MMSAKEVLALRIAGQRLDSRSRTDGASVDRVAAAVVGLQAQEPRSAALGIRSRSGGLTLKDVERSRVDDRSILTAWFMRETLHLIAAEDFDWLIKLLGPAMVAASASQFPRRFGLDDRATQKGLRVIRRALHARGPLTKAEIADELVAQGVKIDPRGQAVIHLLQRVALEGGLCLGPSRGHKPSYVLVSDWLPKRRGPALEGEAALSELARRYLAGYGPASPPDFALWSGLSAGLAKRAWASIGNEIASVETRGGRLWLMSRAAPAARDREKTGPPPVRLLPSFDNFFRGYRDLDFVVSPAHASRIMPGGGILHPTVLSGGRAVATWSFSARSKKLGLIVDAFEPPPGRALRAGIQAEVRDIGRFLGSEAELSPE
jgi:hypothetical protein